MDLLSLHHYVDLLSNISQKASANFEKNFKRT